MVLVLDHDNRSSLLANFAHDGSNSLPGVGDCRLAPANLDLSFRLGVVRIGLFNVDLGASLILDLVDVGTAASEDTSDCTCRYIEFDGLVGLLFVLIGLKRITRSGWAE